ncbi:hypothetical protein TNCV_2641541 [Trichonephila clavipes]|nr:hypothetical protein TNCV_2641541 [Trichonephila clavipes]
MNYIRNYFRTHPNFMHGGMMVKVGFGGFLRNVTSQLIPSSVTLGFSFGEFGHKHLLAYFRHSNIRSVSRISPFAHYLVELTSSPGRQPHPIFLLWNMCASISRGCGSPDTASAYRRRITRCEKEGLAW